MNDIELQIEKLARRVLIRFGDVPEFKEEEAVLFIEDSKAVHGFREDQLIPNNRERLVVLYAMAEIATVVAFKSAHYFKFSDGEESVDKTKVAHNYRQLAKDLRNDYNRERAKTSGSMMVITRRADRP